jgi:hypothetical protein
MDYQYFSILDNSRIPGPKCLSPSTFGCSPRPVLSPVNFTAAGKIAGFATHRRPSGLSPRPGPGAHATQRIDKKGRGLWLATSSAEDSELERLKAKINLLNLRTSGDLPFETNAPQFLKQRRNDLCKRIGILSAGKYTNDDFTVSLDTTSIGSTRCRSR